MKRTSPQRAGENDARGKRRILRRRNVRVLVDYVSREGVRCEYATTLGGGGIFVETDQPLPVGAPLRLRFRIPGGDRLHELEARVVWAHEPKRPEESVTPPGMGIEFTDSVGAAGVASELADLLE